MTSWWELRQESGVLLLHYQNLLDDLEGEMRRVAAHLGIHLREGVWPELVAACRFEAMRADSDHLAPALRWSEGGADSSAWFFHRGTSGQWRETVTDEDLELYDRAVRSLPSDLRRWLEHAGPLP